MILDEAVFSQLLSHALTQRDRLLLEVLWSTGCRVSELTSVERRGFRSQTRSLTLITLKKRVKRLCGSCGKRLAKTHRLCPYCGKAAKPREETQVLPKTRTFILPPDLNRKLAVYARQVKGPRLFPLTRQRVYTIIREIAEKAGYGGMVMQSAEQQRPHYLHPHNFREAFATHWLEKRDDALGQKALQTVLGHERYDTTMRYAKMTPQRVQAVYDDVMGVEVPGGPAPVALEPPAPVAEVRRPPAQRPVRRRARDTVIVSHPQTLEEMREAIRKTKQAGRTGPGGAVS